MISTVRHVVLTGLSIFSSTGAAAQSALDRVDPSRTEQMDAGETLATSENLTLALPATRQQGETLTQAIHLGGVRIVGLRALRQSDFADIIGAYLGRSLSGSDLTELADQIAQRARARGYAFAAAKIGPQLLESRLLQVELDEGSIDEVRIEGSRSEALRQAFSEIATGFPITLAEVERRLLLAGDLHGVTIDNARLSIEGDRRILVVEANRHKVTGWAEIDNYGTRTLGPVATSVGVNLNSVLSTYDALQLVAYNTVFNPSELTFVRARYSERVHASGTEMSISGAWSGSRPGAFLRSANIQGESHWGSISIAQPLRRRRALSIWLNASLDNREVTQKRLDVTARKDRLTVARAGIYVNGQVFDGQVRANAVISRGLDIFDATRKGELTSSRFAARGTFTTLAGWFSWTSPRQNNFAVEFSGSGQLASGPLLLSEEIGLGGDRFLKAYDYNERSGDQGVVGSLEIRYELDNLFSQGRGAQVYAYADAGSVKNRSIPGSGGALASSGFGARGGILEMTNARIELSIPLAGDRFDTQDSSPRLRIGLSRRF